MSISLSTVTFYRVLVLSQNSSAAGNGGAHFAVLAFPAEYRASGVMSFLVEQNGDAYQKDLGPTSAEMCKQMNSANHDNSWQKVE